MREAHLLTAQAFGRGEGSNPSDISNCYATRWCKRSRVDGARFPRHGDRAQEPRACGAFCRGADQRQL